MNAHVRLERVEQYFIPITIHTVKVNINGASGGVLRLREVELTQPI